MTTALDAIDVRTPNSARVYDYMLGGKDNFAADREAAEQVLRVFPETRDAVRRNREFLGNAVRRLAEYGIRQFVDIGAGLPTRDNVHEVAHAAAPGARTVYVDNDPLVCVHGRALLANTSTVAMIDGDVRKPEDIRDQVSQTGLVDWNRPVGLLMVAMLQLVEDPYEHVAMLRDLLAPGSHLVISHLSRTQKRAGDTGRLQDIYAQGGVPLFPRGPETIDRFFGDFERVDLDRFIPPHIACRFAQLGWAAVGLKR
ncbi:SAM-dependent methyltransferase [Sphaerisporangium album]|uniref:SAM-dependent methyltransferase n=1 Tax=Sphaerisporangium album TaxID=509200 RepID=UPI0015F0E8E0|nr:SAM-dependent methyltransferase [Sphaerisporangium album]